MASPVYAVVIRNFISFTEAYAVLFLKEKTPIVSSKRSGAMSFINCVIDREASVLGLWGVEIYPFVAVTPRFILIVR